MNIDLIAIFFTVVLAHFMALLSPGPDFILVVKSGVKYPRKIALGVATGIAVANAFYIALCLIGVGGILASSIIVMTTLKIAGGFFLMYLAIMALRAKKSDYAFLDSIQEAKKQYTSSFSREFITGFLSGILNPKNPLFYLSLFTVVLTPEVGLGFKILLGVWMSSVVFIWDSFIIVALSQKKIRGVFNKMAFYIDKLTGTILGLIGFKIVQSAVFEKAD